MPRQTFTDIHCHILPGIDDGAAGESESLAMAEMALADGIETIIATPHQLGANAGNSGDAIRAAVARFQTLLNQRRLPLTVLPGADVRIEPDLVGKVRRREVVTLGDHGRHVLLELPHEVYLPLDRLLAELASGGIVGILSHPERNRGILRRPGVVRRLVENGCLMQITAGSLTGEFGEASQRLAVSLVEERLVHFVATDAHGVKRRRPQMHPAFDVVARLAGETAAIDLCCRNPAAVARGGVAQMPTPASEKTYARPGWFRRVFPLGRKAMQPI